MMTYLTERQKEILEFIDDFQRRRGIAPTHREICERFGFSSYGTVYKHLKLLQQKGYLRRDWNQKRGIELVRAIPGHEPVSQVDLPFYGRIAAGRPIEAVSGNDRLTVPAHLMAPKGDHYVLQVVGESMVEEGIQDGDFVIVQRRDRAEPGEMVVALIGNEEATLKRFYPEGEQVRLQPANPTMQPFRVRAGEVTVQGIAVGLMRKF